MSGRWHMMLVGIFMLLLPGIPVQAQGPPGLSNASGRDGASDRGPYTFHAAVKEVLVDVAVRDHRGRLMSQLQRSDFQVFEDGVERPISGFWFDEHPIAVALVVDASGSMIPKVREMRRTAVNVLSRLKPVDKVALVVFDSHVRKVVDLTTDRTQIADALGEITAGGTTDIVNALFVASTYLKEHAPEMRRVIVLVSDNDAYSFTVTPKGTKRDQSELIDTALQHETVIYDLRIPGRAGGAYDESPISVERITAETGGAIFKASSARKMLGEVILELRKRYVISFTPRAQSDGRLHRIEVDLSAAWQPSTDYTVHHRMGYREPIGESSGH